MTDEEKKAIEYIKYKITFNKQTIKNIEDKNDSTLVGYGTMHDIYKLQNWNYNIILNLIQKQQEEIDSLNKILDDRLLSIQGGRRLYSKLKGLDKEYLIREYLLLCNMHKQELTRTKTDLQNSWHNNLELAEKCLKQDKTIDLILDKFIEGTEYYFSEFDYMNKEEIKQYFEKKVGESSK